ncbi:MAG: hypothetical protein LBQ36_09095 [Synergistaceae bacterium]|jgi:hypothetical protein|nr:hypothetical protein [Synergistaceae bacterium]
MSESILQSQLSRGPLGSELSTISRLVDSMFKSSTVILFDPSSPLHEAPDHLSLCHTIMDECLKIWTSLDEIKGAVDNEATSDVVAWARDTLMNVYMVLDDSA